MADTVYDLGAISIAWQGAYDGGTTYNLLDAVSYNGCSYICILQSTGNDPTNTTYWHLIASQGDTGSQGVQGVQGIQGDTGNGISSIVRTSGDGSPGSTDTYTITFTDASTTTFDVYNGSNDDADSLGGVAADHYEEQEVLTTGGSADAYTITTGRNYSAYFAGMAIKVKPHADSTATTVTFNVDGLGAKNVKAYGTTDIGAVDFFKTDSVHALRYDGTNFIIQGYSAGGYSIGDVKITRRTNLGSNYLLCNGAAFSSTTYPALAAAFGVTPEGNWHLPTAAGTTSYDWLGVAYGNGWWVAVCKMGACWYINNASPAGTWTQHTDLSSSDINCVRYLNNQFVAVDNDGRCYYTSTPSGAWSSTSINATSDFNSIDFDGTYYYTCSDNTAGYHSTNLTSWISRSLSTSYDPYSCVVFRNGYWAASGTNGLCYRASNPASTWSTVALSGTWFSIEYSNGYWVAVGFSGKCAYSTNLTSWTFNNIGSGSNKEVFYGNGYWVIVSDDGAIYYQKNDPTGAWSKTTAGTEDFYGGIFANDYYIAFGNCVSNENPPIYYKKHSLPIISLGTTYAYIKALD